MTRISFLKLKEFLPGIRKNVWLKDYTTFKVGGRAKYFFIAKTKEDLIKAILAAKKFNLPFFILGGGSNLLISDRGYQGLVINLQFTIFNFQTISNSKILKITAGAGLLLSKLAGESMRKSWTGMEWASGIPGTVGGAIYGNAGSFGVSMAEAVKRVEVLNVNDLQFLNKSQNSNYQIETKFLKNKDCQFGYRESIFKKKKNLIVLSAELEFKKGNKREIEKKTKEYLKRKRETQPLNYPSAGSVFKNLSLKTQTFNLLREKFPALKRFEKNKTIPAAWLMEGCNLKGKKIGQAKISQKHANFIVNLGRAKAKDIKKLIIFAKKEVKKKFDLELKEEIRYLGFEN